MLRLPLRQTTGSISPVSLLFISAEFCENISNEVRMTLININILVPGRRVESDSPSPQFLDMFLSS